MGEKKCDKCGTELSTVRVEARMVCDRCGLEYIIANPTQKIPFARSRKGGEVDEA